MATVFLKAEVPEDLLEKFLQHLRDFDAAHSGRCSFEILASTSLPSAELQEILGRIVPPIS